MITSCKGGVGKSTIAANLGIRLAFDGFRTLLIDCDFGVRSLDLIMGLEDEVVFDIIDVMLRDVPPSKAVIKDSRSENLFFCAAPYNYSNELDPETFRKGVEKMAEELEVEYIIIDTPGDTGIPFHLAAAAADSAIVVSTYQPISIRAAERTGILLNDEGIEDTKLVINCFNPDSKEYSSLPSLTEIIDKTAIRLVGIVPYEAALVESQSRGEDVFSLKKSDAAQAFGNIAGRLVGKNIPLFTGFRNIKREPLLKKIR